MLKKRVVGQLIIAQLVFVLGLATVDLAAIEYKQTLTRIVHEYQLAGAAGSRVITDFAASTDGSKVALKSVASDPVNYGLFLLNSDGTGLDDIATSLLADVDLPTLGHLQFNYDGSKLFFSFTKDHLSSFYYYYSQSDICVPLLDGVFGASSARPYVIERDGTRIWYQHDAGPDPETQLPQRGIFFSSVIVNPEKIMILNTSDLPNAANCNPWFDYLSLLEVSGDGGTVVYRWDRHSTTGGDQAMWTFTDGGTPVMKPVDEHDLVWGSPAQYRGRLVDDEGNMALYEYRDTGHNFRLCKVDYSAPDPDPVIIAETSNPNGFLHESLSPDGAYARFLNPAYFRNTRIHLPTGAMRDTLSTHIYETNSGRFTGLTSDNRYYFMLTSPGNEDMIHRVDMNPVDFPNAPNIVDIGFSSSSLVHDGKTRVSVYAHVSDAQGLPTIEWVKMHTLVDGLENRAWKLINPAWAETSPLYYDYPLYDDGTHGDLYAGDGVYTNNTLRTRSDSGFYKYYPLPHDVGIRIVAKDNDDNYCVADTLLKIRDDNVAFVSRNDATCGGNSPCYQSIQEAINNAETGDDILLADGTYTDPVTLNAPKSLTFQGGWDTSFENQTGTTILRQAPKVLQGSLTLQMLSIKPQ